MGWYDYKPQTNGVEVAKVIKENGNAFTALGKAFDDIGTGIIEKQKTDEESELNKLKKNSMEFAFNQAKEKEAQAKADKDYLTQVYKRPNKKSFEANFDGSIKPSLAAQKEARGYWDDQNKKLELAGAWVDAEDDKDYMKAWGNYQVKNPKENYASFANANPDLVANASVKAISDVRNAWDKKQHDDKLFGLNVKKANANIAQSQASIANSGANKKLHEYQLESAKNKDTENKNTDMFDREYFLAKNKKKFVEDRLSKGEYVPKKYIVKDGSKKFKYSATTGKNIVSLVTKALGMDNSLSLDDSTKQQFNDIVTSVDTIARQYDLPANQAYGVYLELAKKQSEVPKKLTPTTTNTNANFKKNPHTGKIVDDPLNIFN